MGGWAAVLLHGKTTRQLSGGEDKTTNNRMELTAAIRALEALKKPCKVEIYTDSQYVQRGITEWIAGWKRKGWRRGRGAVKNVDLWQALDALVGEHQVTWKWVRGHAGNHYNEICDELASQEISKRKKHR